MTDPKAAKRALRKQVKAVLAALDPATRSAQDAVLQRRFPEIPGLSTAGRVLLYVTAFAEELDTRPLLERVLRQGQHLILPRVDRAGRRLVLLQVDDPGRDLQTGPGGIPEPADHCPEVVPESIDWVLVPGLAFDRRRYRLGRGGGYYDRLLPRLRPDCPRWALALDEQLVEQVPTEPHDQPLDGIVTPSRATGQDGASPEP